MIHLDDRKHAESQTSEICIAIAAPRLSLGRVATVVASIARRTSRAIRIKVFTSGLPLPSFTHGLISVEFVSIELTRDDFLSLQKWKNAITDRLLPHLENWQKVILFDANGLATSDLGPLFDAEPIARFSATHGIPFRYQDNRPSIECRPPCLLLDVSKLADNQWAVCDFDQITSNLPTTRRKLLSAGKLYQDGRHCAVAFWPEHCRPWAGDLCDGHSLWESECSSWEELRTGKWRKLSVFMSDHSLADVEAILKRGWKVVLRQVAEVYNNEELLIAFNSFPDIEVVDATKTYTKIDLISFGNTFSNYAQFTEACELLHRQGLATTLVCLRSQFARSQLKNLLDDGYSEIAFVARYSDKSWIAPQASNFTLIQNNLNCGDLGRLEDQSCNYLKRPSEACGSANNT